MFLSNGLLAAIAMEDYAGESLAAVQGFSVIRDVPELRDSAGTVPLVLEKQLAEGSNS